MAELKRTPVHAIHRRLGARMVEFAGFDMPVQYSSIRAEHTAAREAAALFDVSHMGQLELRGPAAIATAERLLCRAVAPLAVGRIRYGLLCNESGGVVDDVTFYRLADDHLLLVVNAANIEKDYRWLARHAPRDAGLRDDSAATAMFAVQGPESAAVLAAAGAPGAAELRRYRFAELDVADRPARISRTGYTGSDGFEIFCGAGDGAAVFEALLERGAGAGLVPAGLGARDTLRLEAALPLYGHELDDATTPLEAGLDRFVDLAGRAFIGAKALAEQRERGRERALVGFEVEGRGIARSDHPVAVDGAVVGRVTSGAPSITLGKAIGLAYVPVALEPTGSHFDILIRDRPVPARVVETPFV